jgi:translocation and assembly module TamA
VRFYTGGEYSVRGYALDTLGPYEAGGPKGGAAVLVVNEELRVPLLWDTTGVLFLDAGQVYDTTDELWQKLSKAAGLGLRARTPLGVLRLDVALPLDRRPQDSKFKAYVGFGNVF